MSSVMRTSRSRILALVLLAPVLLVVLAGAYVTAMAQLEGETRSMSDALQWAAETLTTTGYGRDDHWNHPVMIAFVILTQFVGVALTFVVFSLVVVPFFEERFEARLPRAVPKLRDYVLVYRYGPSVAPLVEELERAEVPTVILERDEVVARRLFDRGRAVVYAPDEEDDVEPTLFEQARAVVLAGTDQDNAAMVLSVRQQGYEGEVLALADHPLHRRPMMLAGASAVYTPLHILGAAMASLARERVRPRMEGLGGVGALLRTTEVRVAGGSSLAGTTLADAQVRTRTGATVVGRWVDGAFRPFAAPSDPIEPGTILVGVGSAEAVEALGKLATPLGRPGPFVIAGAGEVGRKVAELLRDAGESVVLLDKVPGDGVDRVGDVLAREVLEAAQVPEAKCVVLALGDDSTTLFAASVVRDCAPDVPIVARVQRSKSVARIHRAGADFALSLGQVAAELLAQKMLGDAWISLDARIKLHEVGAAGLEGRSPLQAQVGASTGCSIVAVRRGEDVTVAFPDDFRIEPGDRLFLAAPQEGLTRFRERFPTA
jgi:Trk K+ transport system NAD-binding subunit